MWVPRFILKKLSLINLKEKFPYHSRMDHLKDCMGVYDCKFCNTKSKVKDDHKNECIGYLQDKLKKMEELIKDQIFINSIKS